AVQMMWIPFWAAGVINGIGHYWGYRGYETMDASTNIVPWGILIGGEEMHNNHHAFPSSAKFSTQWWEFDLAWMYIRGLQALGLARVKKLAPKPVIVSGKEHVDMETVRAVIISRLHVMAHYGRDVLLPVLKQELHRADASCRDLLQRARGLLVRERSLMDKEAQHKLDIALKASGALDTVYQFRLRLQEIWGRSAASHENLLRALQEWCSQAEDTGIEVLQNFARTLRGYTLQPA
ncbi:MAG: transposase, partial [Gammaproteobacteria bacterium]|nr:transposase [Gammaproteobacteria bacterium]